jgi:hypothetical protein
MIDLLLDALSVYRLTRLVTRDTITRPARVRIIRWAYEHAAGWIGEPQPFHQTESEWDEMPRDDDHAPLLAELVTCSFCAGLWISFGVRLCRRYRGGVWKPVAEALALSTVAAALARAIDG